MGSSLCLEMVHFARQLMLKLKMSHSSVCPVSTAATAVSSSPGSGFPPSLLVVLLLCLCSPFLLQPQRAGPSSPPGCGLAECARDTSCLLHVYGNMYNSKCEWCGHTRVILNACIRYVYLTKGIWFKIYKVPCNVWAGSILANG